FVVRANVRRLLVAEFGEFLIECGLIAGGLDDRPRAGEHRPARRTPVWTGRGWSLPSATTGAVALSLSIRLTGSRTAAGPAPSGPKTHSAPRCHPHSHARYDPAVAQRVGIVLGHEWVQVVLVVWHGL